MKPAVDPGQGIELKLAMREGANARFEWTADGSVLSCDTHGDCSGQKIRQEQDRGVPEQAGTPHCGVHR